MAAKRPAPGAGSSASCDAGGLELPEKSVRLLNVLSCVQGVGHMSKKSGQSERRVFSDEFRRNAVSLVEDQGYTNAEVARDLAIHENLLRSWRRKYGKKSGNSLSETEQEELARLRAENKRLKMERDILKKATAFFANEKN